MKFIDAEMLKMFHTFTGDMNNKNTKDAIFLQKWPFTFTWPKVKRINQKTFMETKNSLINTQIRSGLLQSQTCLL